MRPLARRLVVLGGAVLGVAALSTPAYALTLAEAKSAGLVGETPGGYLGVVRNAAGVAELVQSVNAQRRQRYQEIARSNNVPLAAVEQRAGRQLIQRAAPGEYYMNDANQWVRR